VLVLPTHSTTPLFLFAQLRQRGTIDALRAEHVGVIDLQELFGSEGFRRTKDHVSRVVGNDIETAVFLDDSLNDLVG
jgi:hypothetical protein